MGKVLGTVAVVVGIAALAVTGAGFVFGAAAVTAALGGVSAAMLTTAAAVLSIGASLLAPRPKAPGISPASVERLNVTLEPRTPRKAVLGNTAGATDLRDHEVTPIPGTKDDLYVHRFIVCAAHKATSIDEVWFDDEKVWTLAGGVTGSARNYLTVTPILEGSAANAINVSSRMGSTRRFTGCAYVHLRYRLNGESPYDQGIPTRVTIRGKWMPVYDPRKDTSVGGAGTQRADDQSTWTYDSGGNLQGENPACQLLTWLLGWRIQNPVTLEWKLSVGKGIPVDRIDLASFIAAANACDEAVALAAGGTEKRYRGAGIASEAEDPIGVVDRWKAAMNATLDDVDGQLRLTVLANDLGAPVADFTEADIIDEFSWKPRTNLTGDQNIIRGSYVDATDDVLYQLSEYPEIKLTSRDGIDRIETVDYDVVQSHTQAQRLSKQRLQRAQYPGVFQAVYQVTGWKVQKGDVVRQTFGPLGFNLKLFRVIEMEHRGDGLVPMTLREENAAIYAWDSSEEGEVNYAAPVAYSLADTPWQRLMQGIWIPPVVASSVGGNMLSDALFGGNWTLTGFARTSGAAEGAFPDDASLSYVAETDLGSGSLSSAATAERVPVVPGRTYWQRFRVAKETTASGTASIDLVSEFYDAAGVALGSGAFSVSTALASVPADGSYLVVLAGVVAPAGAASLDFQIEVPANAASGTIRIEAPHVTDKEPGADITRTIDGPSQSTIFLYDHQGTAETGQFTRNLTFKLNSGEGQVTSGISWTYTVVSGTVNGFDNADGAQAMSGAGTGTLAVTSLDTDTANVEVTATYQGVPRSTIVPFEREYAAPPLGGGTTGTLKSKSSGWPSINSTSFSTISGTSLHDCTAPGTTLELSASLTFSPDATGTGNWTVELKWQRDVGGIWTDVGSPAVVSGNTSQSGPALDPVITPATITNNQDDTGLTASTTYDYQLVARLVSGSRIHYVSGSASVVAP